jgi:hypothetical protein
MRSYRPLPMRALSVFTGILMTLAAGVFAQDAQPDPTQSAQKPETLPGLVRTAKKPAIYTTPRPEGVSDKDWQTRLWNTMTDNDPSELAIRNDRSRLETTPFWSRFSVWSDATTPERSASFGVGKLSDEAAERPSLEDRRNASQSPDVPYSSQAQDNAIFAAVYRYFFGYRSRGFGANAHALNQKLHVGDVYFIGFGPHVADPPASFLAALQADPGLKRDGVTLCPLSRSLEVTDDAIRDRDTGAYGLAFRIDDVTPGKDGDMDVLATFSERDGFWFSRELTLRQNKSGSWNVVADDPCTVR